MYNTRMNHTVSGVRQAIHPSQNDVMVSILQIDLCESKLQSVLIPNEISRTPSCIHDSKTWKGICICSISHWTILPQLTIFVSINNFVSINTCFSNHSRKPSDVMASSLQPLCSGSSSPSVVLAALFFTSCCHAFAIK